jgi:uncharacterized protein (TIGR02145 family)
MFGKKCTACATKVGGLFGKKNHGTADRMLCEPCSNKERLAKESAAKEQLEREQLEKQQEEILEKSKREPLTDIDGNIYQTIQIGNQVWTVENLKTTKYNDGTPILLITVPSEWSSYGEQKKPAYCFYDNDKRNKEKYGALYNWYAVNTGKLAPKGWHVPSDPEWTKLEVYLIANGFNCSGTKEDLKPDSVYGYIVHYESESTKIAKSMAAKTDWKSDSVYGNIGCYLSKNNRSGFSALPGGCRDNVGYFSDQSIIGYWWSAMETTGNSAWKRGLVFDFDRLGRSSSLKGCGYSVRLLRDN